MFYRVSQKKGDLRLTGCRGHQKWAKDKNRVSEFVYFPKNSIKRKTNRTPFSNYAPPRYSSSSNVAVFDKFWTFLVSAGRLFAGQVHPCG